MPKIRCAILAGFALLEFGLIGTLGPKQARAENSPVGPETVLASRNLSPGIGGLHGLHHQMRHERVVRRRFHGPRVIGIDGGVAVPVPQENEEGYPLEPSFDEYGYTPFPPSVPVLVLPPQIITLPDVHPGRPKGVARDVVARTPAPHRRVGEVHRRAPRLRAGVYRTYRWPVTYICWPYAGAVIPIAFAPCDDPPHSAIYNTPCGVRPYR